MELIALMFVCAGIIGFGSGFIEHLTFKFRTKRLMAELERYTLRDTDLRIARQKGWA